MPSESRRRLLAAAAACGLVAGAACGAPAPASVGGSPGSAGTAVAAGLPFGSATEEQVLWGRRLVIARDCGGCHGGSNPAEDGWLAGTPGENDAYVVDDVRAWAKNLTPDPETGLGRYTHRQIFNALRYGLRPRGTPDIEVTSPIPGDGNHPRQPNYLSPAMPWPSWRHMSDAEIWAVVAYLTAGLEPVRNEVREAEVPPDGWASWFGEELIGSYPAPPFPTVNEMLHEGADREQVLRGRSLVLSMACSECHGGRGNPAATGWLAGVMPPEERPRATMFETRLQVGQFATYPRNLTPHNTTGLGRFSERQIFNALRFGLRPGETADVEVTSTVPGEGNHPRHPKYLPPSMPWVAWRHLEDAEIRAIIAYLKYGLKPVRNRVPDSEGPPDFWGALFGSGAFGPYPGPAYPTTHERRAFVAER